MSHYSQIVKYDDLASFPAIGDQSRLYVADDTVQLYIWNGSAYEPTNSSSQGWTGSVDVYGDLPTASDYTGEVWLVYNPSGTWPNDLPAGLWESDGIAWIQIPATAGMIRASDVKNDLISTDTNKPLSANQGKVLNDSKQPLAANLTDIAALSNADGNFIVGDGSNFVAESGATARTSLDVYSTSQVDALVAAVPETLWGFQDFSAGAITGTSVTLTANQNGTGAEFTPANFYNYAAIYRSDNNGYVYNSAIEIDLLTLVKVSSQTGASITLNRIPYSTTPVRIWFMYKGHLPNGYIVPPQDILNSAAAIQLDTLFVADSEIGVTVQAYSARLTDIAALTPSSGNLILGNGSTWVSNAMSGDVAINSSGVTSISSSTVTGKLLTGYSVGSNTAIAATDSILQAFQKTQGQINAITGGYVTSISGTANRITASSSTGAVTIDISASYVGQSSITTLGTIATGVWQGTKIAEAYGGTNQSTYTTGDTLYASASNTLSKLAGNTTTTKKYLSQTGDGANSAAPAWSVVDGSDITGAALTRTNDTNVTLTLGGTPTTALLRATSLTLGWTGQLGLSRGGTNADLSATGGTSQVLRQSTAGAAITVSQLAASDLSNGTSGSGAVALVTGASLSLPIIDNAKFGYTTTATAAGTTTLTVSSNRQQYFTGSTTQTVTLPVTSTLVTGFSFEIVNLSSGVVTVQSSGGNTLQAMAANTRLVVICTSTSGTGTASWDWFYLPVQQGITGTGNLVLANSPVFTTPNIGTATGSVSGNAGTATALQNARTIGAVSFDGTANIVPQTIQTVDDTSDTSCFIAFFNSSGTQTSGQQPKTNSGLTYNASTNTLSATTFSGAFSGTVTTANNVATANEASDTTCFLTFVTASGTQSSIPVKTNTALTYDSSTNTVGVTSLTGVQSITGDGSNNIAISQSGSVNLNLLHSGTGTINVSNSGGGVVQFTSAKSSAGALRFVTSNSSGTTDFVSTAATEISIGANSVTVASLTASQAVVTDSSKKLTSLAYASANTASALVQRDASGNFSAGTITATAFTGPASAVATADDTSDTTCFFAFVNSSGTQSSQSIKTNPNLIFNASTNAVSIGGTASAGVFTPQLSSTTAYAANTDPTDSNRIINATNNSTNNGVNIFSCITLQANPTGALDAGRIIGDIRLVRRTANQSTGDFYISGYRQSSTYADFCRLSYDTSIFYSNLDLGANNLTLTGSIASSGSRSTKGWFTDLDVSNTITGACSSITTATESTDQTCFPVFVTASGTQTLAAKTNTGLTYDAAHNALGVSQVNASTIGPTSGTLSIFIGTTLGTTVATFDTSNIVFSSPLNLSSLTVSNANDITGDGVNTLRLSNTGAATTVTSTTQINISGSSTGAIDIITSKTSTAGAIKIRALDSASTVQIIGAQGTHWESGNGAVALKTGTTSTNTMTLGAYDVDGTTYRTFITLTAANTPTLAISAPSGGSATMDNVTIGATTAAAGTFTTLTAAQGIFSGASVTNLQGCHIVWNQATGGTGETDIVNHRGAGSGGINFYDTNSAGLGTKIFGISPVGVLSVTDGTNTTTVTPSSSGLAFNKDLTVTSYVDAATGYKVNGGIVLKSTGSQINMTQTQKTDVFSTSSSSWTDWTGMTANLTTTKASSKILVSMTSGVSNDSNNSFQYVSLWYSLDNSSWTQIALGDSSGSATRCWIDAALGTPGSSCLTYNTVQKPLAGEFLHSPAQSAGQIIYYKLQVIRTLNGTAYFGRTADTSDANRSAIPSTLTLREIA